MTNTAPDPTRVVADADVLAADLLVGGDARDALDLIRAHSWLHLVVTSTLLDETESLIGALSEPSLAVQWRERIESEAILVEPSLGGHHAIVAAEAGNAATVLSLDDRLNSAAVGVSIRPRVATSIKSPPAFVRLVDPESLYPTVVGGDYPGPDRDPRS